MVEPSEVSVRDLRNSVSEILRRVEAGERIRITVDRRPVAQLIPLPRRRVSLSFAEFRAWRARGGGPIPGSPATWPRCSPQPPTTWTPGEGTRADTSMFIAREQGRELAGTAATTAFPGWRLCGC